MAEINAQLVKTLRDKTSAGMMECKNALKETNGDLDAAVDLLRKKGIAATVKRADRDAKEGAVLAVLSPDGKTAAVIELNCETDFVAKNDGFRAFLESMAQVALTTEVANSHDVAALLATPGTDGSATLDETIRVKASQMGENLVLRRARRYPAAANTALSTYIHMGGKVGVILELSLGKAETRTHESFLNLMKDICMHICAASPEFVKRDEVSATVIEKESEIQRERMKDKLAGKPDAMIAKIIEGSIGKFFSQICLLEQGFVKNPDQTIEQLVASVGKELGDEIKVVQFARLALGEELKA